MALNDKILGVVTLLYLVLFFIHLVYFATKKEVFSAACGSSSTSPSGSIRPASSPVDRILLSDSA